MIERIMRATRQLGEFMDFKFTIYIDGMEFLGVLIPYKIKIEIQDGKENAALVYFVWFSIQILAIAYMVKIGLLGLHLLAVDAATF